MTIAVNGRAKKRKPAEADFWLAYEKRVAALVSALDAHASITHNEMQVGALSGVPRQIDALAVGSIAGQKLKVVIEAKCYGRRVSIGTVDEFIGKLLDLGAERGILYAAGGFTTGAVKRAERALNPGVALEHLANLLPPRPRREGATGSDHADRLSRLSPIAGEDTRLRPPADVADHLVASMTETFAIELPYQPSVPTTTSYRAFLLGEAFFYKS
ncbi:MULTISPECIES: restriction endonuclease [Streptomyces]|uniref:Restriction endonuclease n=1 Tax=Streptomyces sudanensis TaxID=436397 RepID=A0ABY4TK74_9ACTN|nr:MULTISPECIES: restriction endonuclease [Streptomyces]MCP9956076.1 restriction endonuclease [Streptomyces sudanensis]MCQ0003268.1 restriction endonuclease [Streptomyces sudanensis]URN18554.1 restriction endonuclease [Streptomyces sudanensis]